MLWQTVFKPHKLRLAKENSLCPICIEYFRLHDINETAGPYYSKVVQFRRDTFVLTNQEVLPGVSSLFINVIMVVFSMLYKHMSSNSL